MLDKYFTRWYMRVWTTENFIVLKPFRSQWTKQTKGSHCLPSVEYVINDAFEIESKVYIYLKN